ncbi:hypothetical protein E4T56_gene7488, partial [Termitomyces sp. T112]
MAVLAIGRQIDGIAGLLQRGLELTAQRGEMGAGPFCVKRRGQGSAPLAQDFPRTRIDIDKDHAPVLHEFQAIGHGQRIIFRAKRAHIAGTHFAAGLALRLTRSGMGHRHRRQGQHRDHRPERQRSHHQQRENIAIVQPGMEGTRRDEKGLFSGAGVRHGGDVERGDGAGHDKAEVPPDYAHVLIDIVTRNGDRAEAINDGNTLLSKLKAALIAKGVGASDIERNYFGAREEFENE